MDQERDIEAYLRRRVEMLGGMAMKFVSPGGRLRAIQKWQHERIRKRGCEVRVIWNRMQVDEWMQEKGGKEG